MSILVTGGAGFIGSNLCEYLLNNTNKQIICIDNLISGRECNIKSLLENERFIYIKSDIVTYDYNNLINYNIKQIYHLACPASPPYYQKYPLETLKTNILGTINILEYSIKNDIRVLFTSTSEVYGDPIEHPQKETYWGNVNNFGIRSCYDEGKRVSETLCLEYNRKYNVDVRICRIFNTYGPKLNPYDGRVVSNFIKQSLLNEDITIYGNGNQTRSLCYIDDTLEALFLLMNTNKKQSVCDPINIGNHNEIRIKELALVIKELCKSNSKLVYNELPLDDPKIRNPDINKAKDILNWIPKIKLNNGLINTIDYYKNNELNI